MLLCLLDVSGIWGLPHNFRNSSLITATCNNSSSAGCVSAAKLVCKDVCSFRKHITSLKKNSALIYDILISTHLYIFFLVFRGFVLSYCFCFVSSAFCLYLCCFVLYLWVCWLYNWHLCCYACTLINTYWTEFIIIIIIIIINYRITKEITRQYDVRTGLITN